MPELKQKRISFKKLSLEDAEGLLPIWSDHEVVEYTYIQQVKDLDACTKSIEQWINESEKRKDAGPYVILLNSIIIGLAGGAQWSEESGEHELYYHFGKQYWGNGYATEVCKMMIDIIFSTKLQVQRISAEVVPENIGSWKVLEKAGMKREGCLRSKFFKDNMYRDLYVYSVLRSEWQYGKGTIEID